MKSLFALWLTPGGLGIVELAILIVIVAAVIALVYVAIRQFGIAIPAWVVQIF